MIITDTLKARGYIDRRYVDDGSIDGLAMLAGKIRKELIAIGEGYGAFIRPESIFFVKRQGEDALMQYELVGEWAPDPMEGVELKGGALDGKVLPMERTEGARPPYRCRLPAPMEAAGFKPETDRHPSPSLSADYTRAGIDSERDRWVYQAE